jgi:hypothetical protein
MMGRVGGIAHILDATTSWLGKEHREDRISKGMFKATIETMLPMSAWNIDSSSTEYIEPSLRKAKSYNTHTCDLLKQTAMDAYLSCAGGSNCRS